MKLCKLWKWYIKKKYKIDFKIYKIIKFLIYYYNYYYYSFNKKLKNIIIKYNFKKIFIKKFKILYNSND